MRKTTVEILCWSSFLLLTGATALAFPKLMGMLIDCVKNKDNTQANNIAFSFDWYPFMQSIFSFF
jgi:hypothetical protein